MMYWQSVVVGISVVIGILVWSLLVYIFNKDSCHVGTFACSIGGKCVPQRNVCNYREDCANGEDEDPVFCSDLNGSINMVNKIANVSYNDTIQFRKTEGICEIASYPPQCICKYTNRIFCKNIGLKEIPQNISPTVAYLILANNSIHILNKASFKNYSLTVLHLEGNQLVDLPPGIFRQQTTLERLLSVHEFLMKNNLTEIKLGVFRGLSKLTWLFLDDNFISSFHSQDLEDLESLEWINLSNNLLDFENFSFPKMPKLMEMFLDENVMEKVTNDVFSNLHHLELLSLRRNKIAYIENAAFKNLQNLRELDLHENRISTLPENVFSQQTLLEKIYLGKNPLRYIPSKLFHNLTSLASLNLEEIEIENIDLQIFWKLINLESVYFKKYRYCSYAPNVPRCRPLSDGVSSRQRLLAKPILRYSVWIICFLTCIGNIVVLWGRSVFRDENKTLSLVIRNLAVSDLLMGIYLFIIGYHDLKYKHFYNLEAHFWMESWTCVLTGILALVSSEVSMLLLVFLSIDRFFLIAIPYRRFSSISAKETMIVLVVIWSFGIGIAVIPVIEYFSSTRFYGINGLCFPLHLEDPYFLGWEYSVFIFLGINAISLLMLAILYVGMFISVWRTRNATSLPMKDFEFAIRFFLVVLTDACCWFPIIALKIYVLTGREISGDLYGWVVVFVLPINSALNPLLYTFTTTKYRNKIYNAKFPVPISHIKEMKRQSAHSTANDSGSAPVLNKNVRNWETKF